MILNHNTEFQIVKFNLRGELVFETTYDDEDITERTINMVKANEDLSLTTPETEDNFLDAVKSSNNEFRFSKVFLGSSKGRFYRLASIVMVDKGKNQDSIVSESFSLFGAVEIPMNNPSKKEF